MIGEGPETDRQEPPLADRQEPLSRIPDELIETVLGLLQEYADKHNPGPTAEDMAARLGAPADLINRACRKLEINGDVIIIPSNGPYPQRFSVPVEESDGAVPEELLDSVMGLIRAYDEHGNPAPTVPDMSAGLGARESDVRWACSALKADGLVRIDPNVQGKHSGYKPVLNRVSGDASEDIPVEDDVPEDNPVDDDAFEDEPVEDTDLENVRVGKVMPEITPKQVETRDKLVFAVLRSAALVFQSELDVAIQLSENELREDQVTTEDISVFLRVTGGVEGSVYFGFDRPVALGLLEAAQRDPSKGIDAESIKMFNDLVTRVGEQTRHELDTIGYDVDISSAASVQKAGMRVTTHGYPQVVTTLDSSSGPIEAHVSLQEPLPDDEEVSREEEPLAA